MESRKLSPIRIRKPVGKSSSLIQDIIGFLNENYDIRVNSFDPNRSIIVSKTKTYQFPPSFDDISLHLSESGIAHSDTLLRKILRSPNQVNTYNPITDYFSSLKGRYEGTSHIDLMASYLAARDFGDQEEGYYQKRMIRLLRKWLVATVACALDNHPNEAALGFIQREEGVGKTYLTRFLVPETLTDYYIISQASSQNFILQEAFAKNLILNFDELVGINSRSADEFKKVMSGNQVRIKHYRDPFPMTVNRIASAVFTTNRNEELGGFISPEMGSRRFACIELDGINQEYSSKVNIDQVWAEAVMLMDQEAFEFRFLMDDFNEFNSYNERYREQTTALRLIEAYYIKPETSSEGEFLQPQQILQELTRNRLIPSSDKPLVSSQKIGEALRQLKFDRKIIRIPNLGPRYVYHVKKV